MTDLDSLEQRITVLEQKVAVLETRRPGRKALPILVSEPDTCGVDPARDATTCPDASLYRHQKGCRGTACRRLNADYYTAYRRRRQSAGAAPLPDAATRTDPPDCPDRPCP